MLVSLLLLPVAAAGQKRSLPKPHGLICRFVTFEGAVDAGQPFRKQFTSNLEFFLEPLASGWIVRVLAMRDGHEVRESHDYAGVATPPYRSPSPLLLSTDWAFRAQDAVAWNPRDFRYAANAAAFAQLSAAKDRITSGDHKGEVQLTTLVLAQPEASLRILDAKIAPGAQNEAAMASAVATQHVPVSVETLSGSAASPLGRIAYVHFRVRLDLPAGVAPAANLTVQQQSCNTRPTE